MKLPSPSSSYCWMPFAPPFPPSSVRVTVSHRNRWLPANRGGIFLLSHRSSFEMDVKHRLSTNLSQGLDGQSVSINLRKKKCLHCGELFSDEENGPKACAYHGHMTGDRGLFAIAPPHQGIDGEWTDESGVIVYKWNDPEQRPNTGRKNWKRRWTCCGEYEEEAQPCRRGWHVSYDDGATRF